MNVLYGAGIGVVIGACVGKMFQPQIEREVSAVVSDYDRWNERRNRDENEGMALNDLITYLDSYPSVFRRIEGEYYRVLRGIDNVRRIPRNIREFIHRGRHGWADSDVWNADTHIVSVLLGMLENYKEHTLGHPFDTTEDEWDKVIDEIIYGLRQYTNYYDYYHTLPVEDAIEAQDASLAALKRSFELLSNHLPDIWI